MNYKVYQGTELKQTVTSKTAVMNGLQPNRTYEFGVQPNDGNRDGPKAITSVTTRGIRFNIPKTLTVGSTITLRYEEYPLGIVRIGQEPSGMFGGGNKQNLSAKVISTSTVYHVLHKQFEFEIGDAAGKNYLVNSSNFSNVDHWVPYDNTALSVQDGCLSVFKDASSPNDNIGVGQTVDLSPNELGKNFTVRTVVKNASDSTIKSMTGIVFYYDGDGKWVNQSLSHGPDLNLSSDFKTFEFNGTIPNDSIIAKALVIFMTDDTANGSSVVEVGGNVIEVGGTNLITGTSSDLQTAPGSQSNATGGFIHNFSSDELSIIAGNQVTARAFIHNTTTHTVNLMLWNNLGGVTVGTDVPTGTDGYSTLTASISSNSTMGNITIRAYADNAEIVVGAQYNKLKLEFGDIATPYAAFVDGDTFTAQPDGTFALFSEYKALYY